MIPQALLKNYQNRALGICIYGNGGLEKTLSVRTLPSPILELDFEGGSGCLGPWTRRTRRWDEKDWTEYSQAERENLLSLVNPERQKRALLKPAPLIDIVAFNTMTSATANNVTTSPGYDECYSLLTNLNYSVYNSISVDPLVEFSQLTQTQSKIKSGVGALEPMHVKLWQGAQERAAILLRLLREYRDKGIFIYMTSSEFVDKDYGTDPRESNQKEEPYAIKGTVNVPGQLVTKLNHMVDIQCHVRMMNGAPVWVTQEEPARSGSFNWEAKDRTGRVAEKFVTANVRPIVKSVYGEEAFKEIYSQKETK